MYSYYTHDMLSNNDIFLADYWLRMFLHVVKSSLQRKK